MASRALSADALSARIRKAAKEELPAIIANLLRIAQDKRESAASALAASRLLFEFGWGKPTEMVEHTGTIDHQHRTIHEYYGVDGTLIDAREVKALTKPH